MTYDHAVYVLRVARPFAGSVYEKNAIAVYEHGLFAPGAPVYASLDDALADWQADYERELADTARAIASGELPANPWHMVMWCDGDREPVTVRVNGEDIVLKDDQVIFWLGQQLADSLQSDSH